MKTRRGAVCLVSAALIFSAAPASLAQRTPEVRRAQPVEEPPVAKAIPSIHRRPLRRCDRAAPAPALPPEPNVAPSQARQRSNPEQPPPEPPPTETEAPDQRQLDYANAIFSNKLYDLAVPEYEKYWVNIRAPGSRERLFLPAECLSRAQPERGSSHPVFKACSIIWRE